MKQSSNLALDWTKGLSAKQKEDMESLARVSLVLSRLKTLIEEYEQEVSDSETSKADYDNPSWAFKQADRNGYRRGLKKIKSLLQHLG